MRSTEGFLAELGEYYDPDRVCILAADPQSGRVRRVYQWYRSGAAENEDNAFSGLGGLADWIENLEAEGVFLWPDGQNSEASSFLQAREIRSLMAVPTAGTGEETGILCVVNPGKHKANSLLLMVAASVWHPGLPDRLLQDAEADALDRGHII